MAAGGNAQQSLRKALGALKDSTTVGLAKVNSENKDLGVAIVKATNHVEKVAKDKHIQKIFDAVSASRPRADVAYCIHALARRLAKTHNWAVALKTLIVIHRALREVDPTFLEELINYSRSRGRILNLSHFKDESSPNAWDYSAWVRNYALYLEECLECFRILKYDVQTNRSRTKELDTLDLIEHLPALQQVLFRLLSCQPKGTARCNYLIQYAFAIVAAESVRIYVAITDGTLNLIDKFFEMQRHDAVRALTIYRRAVHQAERLSEFLELCRSLDFGRGQKYIKIEQPPASFLAAMEDYVKVAPQTLMLPWRESNDDRGATPRAVAAPEPDLETDHKQDNDDEEKSDPIVTSPELNDHNEAEATPQPEVTDLLGLDESTQEASELDDKNALALAIFTPENPSNFENSSTLACQSTDWELALVTAPSSNGAAVAESTLAGGLDRLTLHNLYDNAIVSTNQNGHYHMGQVVPNPLEAVHYTQDMFHASSNVTPPTSVQMVPNPLETVHYTQDLFHASSNVKPPTSVQMAPNPLEAVYYSQDLFHASRNITPPTSMQMAVMAQQQDALIVQQQQQLVEQQQSMIGCDRTNPFRNPFVEQGALTNSSHTSYSGLI